jgi:hypothetical protein
MDQWTPQRRVLSTYGSAFRRRRSFHRVGLGIAATIVATGLAFIGAAVIRLELLEFLRADIFSIVLGLTFVLLGVIAISAYGVVRAIEWFSRSCPDEWWQAREVR